MTLVYLLVFWKSKGKDNPVDLLSLLVAGILLIFVVPMFAICIGWFFVFCYQQATQDFMHHCFDSTNRFYWASIRLGTTEPLLVYLLLFPFFGVVCYLYYLLVKGFKSNQQYFETKLNTEEQLALAKIQEKRRDEEMAKNDSSSEEDPEERRKLAPVLDFQNGPKSRSPSRSRSHSRDKSSPKSSKKSIAKKEYQPLANDPKPESRVEKLNVFIPKPLNTKKRNPSPN